MNCQKCGNELNPNMKFCAKCGTPVQQPAAPVTQQQPVQPKPVVPAQPKPAAPAPSKETAQPAPKAGPKKPEKQKKAKKKGGKKNIALRVIAIILVIAVLATGGIFITDAIIFKSESEKAGYITDFPVLKQDAEFLVYDAENFPYENYNIKVDRLTNGTIFKSSAFNKFENVINEKSDSKIFNLHLNDGKYQITLEGIVSERTQPVSTTVAPTVPSNTETTTSATKSDEPVVIVIIVIVDNDDKDAVDKVTINSKKDDEPIKDWESYENNSAGASGSSSQKNPEFIKATDADIEEFVDFLNKTFGRTMQGEEETFDSVEDILLMFECSGSSAYSYFFGDVEYNQYNTGGAYQARIPKENVKWLCENIYNIEYRENLIYSDSDKYEGSSSFDDDYFYVPEWAATGVLKSSYELVSYKIVDDKYHIVVDVSEEQFETDGYEYSKTLEFTAEIKIIDGKRYWSIYKIENYDPNTTQTPSTPKDMYDENAKLYNEVLKDARWGKYMPEWYGLDCYEIQTCMLDINDDGVYELLVKFVPSSADWYATESLLFTIKNDGVVFLHKEHDEGYRMGGTQLSIFYDNVQKKNVLVAYTAEGDGGTAGHTAYKTFNYDGTSLSEKENYEVSSYMTTERGYSIYKEQIDRIKAESDLYIMDGDIIRSYTLNEKYISKAEYEKNTENRFVESTDSKYQMKPGTYENPLGLN